MASEGEKKPTTSKAVKKTPPKRRYSVTAAARVASGLMSSAMRAKGFAQAEVVTRWSHIVGPELAGSTVPVRLLYPRGQRMGAKLIVRCESAFAPLLQHKRDRVIEQVNGYFGYGAVASIEVKQGPLPKERRKPLLEKKELSGPDRQKLGGLLGNSPENSPLREALKSLGEMVFSNRKEKDQ